VGELGVPLRWAFSEPARLARTNTYVAVKRRVGATAATIDEYSREKNAIVLQILAAAGLTEADRAAIAAHKVADAVRAAARARSPPASRP
jgi:hypothetical protein